MHQVVGIHSTTTWLGCRYQSSLVFALLVARWSCL